MKKQSNQVVNKKAYLKLSLEQIEETMTELALTTTTSNFFLNGKKIEMLEKIGNFKAKRIQIEQQQQLLDMQKEQLSGTSTPEPIKVEFIEASNQEATRVEKIKQDVEDTMLGKNNA